MESIKSPNSFIYRIREFNRLKCKFLILLMLLLIVLNVDVYAESSQNTDKINQKIEHLINILEKDYTPTLKDYQWVMGYSDFPELQLFWKHCYKKLDSAPLRDQICFDELISNWANKNKSPSYYLQWLKNQLPKNTKPEILSTNLVKQKNRVVGTKVKANLNNVQIMFWLPSNNLNKVGNVQILSVDSVPISVMTQQTSESSVLFALGLKTMVRPQTKKEQDFENKKRRKMCDANPECVKQRSINMALTAIHEKEMKESQKITKIYKTWCNKNITICENERVARQKNNELVWQLNKECEMNFNSCIPKVENWYKSNKNLKNTFCKIHNEECAGLDEIRELQKKRSKDENEKFCSNQSNGCSYTDEDAFNRALIIVKRKKI